MKPDQSNIIRINILNKNKRLSIKLFYIARKCEIRSRRSLANPFENENSDNCFRRGTLLTRKYGWGNNDLKGHQNASKRSYMFRITALFNIYFLERIIGRGRAATVMIYFSTPKSWTRENRPTINQSKLGIFRRPNFNEKSRRKKFHRELKICNFYKTE